MRTPPARRWGGIKARAFHSHQQHFRPKGGRIVWRAIGASPDSLRPRWIGQGSVFNADNWQGNTPTHEGKHKV